VTILELLTVFGVLILMLAILLPSLSMAREHARRVVCANNLRQWGVALQFYRDEHEDYLPTEGTYLYPEKPYTWFNVLPPYLNAPAYKDVERIDDAIVEFPALHIWICPSKYLSKAYKSQSGKNQFHYGMNAVLDGMNSSYTPDLPDLGEEPIHAGMFRGKPHTVFLFDIFPNDSRGHPKDVGALFHRNYANVLYVSGAVDQFQGDRFVTDGDFRSGKPIWTDPKLYWGYSPPKGQP